ncbi:MAG: hypothetical protein HYX37_18025 [Rhizobiales bacterium]|nr:hypothetical protein [Hyphomicrobiales bacterium]
MRFSLAAERESPPFSGAGVTAMSTLVASSDLDWGWIGFVGLWLLIPLLFFIASLLFFQRWLGCRHK